MKRRLLHVGRRAVLRLSVVILAGACHAAEPSDTKYMPFFAKGEVEFPVPASARIYGRDGVVCHMSADYSLETGLAQNPLLTPSGANLVIADRDDCEPRALDKTVHYSERAAAMASTTNGNFKLETLQQPCRTWKFSREACEIVGFSRQDPFFGIINCLSAKPGFKYNKSRARCSVVTQSPLLVTTLTRWHSAPSFGSQNELEQFALETAQFSQQLNSLARKRN